MEAKEFFKQAKVGSLVDLRKDLKVGTYGTDSYIKDMPAPGTCGLVIRTICEDVNKFRVKDCIWNLTPEMVERVYSKDSEKRDTEYKVGDIVTFRSDLKENELNKGTNLTFFTEGPVKAGCMATIVEILPDSSAQRIKYTVFRVKGSPYFYDSGMLSKDEKVEKSEDTTMLDRERTVRTILDRVDDIEKVLEFLDHELTAGCVVKIRENIHRTASYWGCNHLPDSMLESGRTAKITNWYRTIEFGIIHGNRFYLDKDKADYPYSVPMFDTIYCITRNPSIYKKFLETFDVDTVTESKKETTSECKISAELIRESIKKLQELEKAFEKMLQ